VQNAGDLVFLGRHQLIDMERMAEKSADNLLAAMEAARHPALDRLIFALGIPLVGESMAKTLAVRFGSLEALQGATAEELQTVRDIGPEAAGSIVRYFSDPASQKLLARLQEAGVRPRPVVQPESAGLLSGSAFVFTGTLKTMTRNEAKQMVESRGGTVLDAVGRKATHVVAGEKAGSKLDKARALGVTILNEKEFLEWMNHA
jgi:DNA ligase (NAD+)